MSKLYVGGLPFAMTADELKELFSRYGNVVSANVITDKFSGRSRGFGFVEMGSAEEGQAAISGLNNTEYGGRTITVSEARPMRDKRDFAPRGGSQGRFSGGGGRYQQDRDGYQGGQGRGDSNY